MKPALPAGPADITIVGAGAIGLAAAYYAARAGASVLVLDRDRVGAGASEGNAGLVVPSFLEPLCSPGAVSGAVGELFDPEGFFGIKPRLSLDLARWLLGFMGNGNRRHYERCLGIYQELGRHSSELHAELAAELPRDYEYRQSGLLYVYANPRNLEQGRKYADLAGGYGARTRVMDGAELKRQEPGLAPDLAGAVYFEDDAMLHPLSFVRALAQGVEQYGGTIISPLEVYDFEFKGGRATALMTTAGRLPVKQVVLASGAWLAGMGRRLGSRLPVEGGLGISLTFDPVPDMPTTGLLLDSHGAVTPFNDGLRITGLLQLCGCSQDLDPRRVQGIWRKASRYLPALREARARQVWRGLRPCTPDDLPIVGRLARCPNVLAAGGHAQKGISLAPVSGWLLYGLLSGEPRPDGLLRALSPARFGA